MNRDSIVQEVREMRNATAKEFEYDPDAIVRDLGSRGKGSAEVRISTAEAP